MINFIPNTTQLFNMTDEQYFGNGLPDHISNSKMGLINPAEGGSTNKYLNGFGEQKSEALQLGSAVHQLILEKDNYKLADVVVPSDSLRKIATLTHKLTTREDNPLEFDDALEIAITTYNYYKGNCKKGSGRYNSLVKGIQDYYSYLCGNNDKEGLILLPPDLKERCLNALAAIENNINFEKLLNPKLSLTTHNDDIESFNEYVMTCSIDYKGFIYHLKLKIDNFTINHTKKHVTLNDLKTTSFRIDNFMGSDGVAMVSNTADGFSIGPVKIHGSFQKYHYYRQMYMYSTILKQWIKEHLEDEYTFETNMLVVETAGYKPKAEVFSVSDYWMGEGEKEFDFLFELIHALLNEGKASEELSDLTFISEDDVESDNLNDLSDF